MSEPVVRSGALRIESPPPGWGFSEQLPRRRCKRRAVFDDLVAFMRANTCYSPRGCDVAARWPDIPRNSAYSVLRRARQHLDAERGGQHARA